jgi:ketosteroid isomerase-like protein
MVPGFLAPDFRLENISTALSDKTWVGEEGMREWMNDHFGAFAPGAEFRADEVVAEGDDYVVAICSVTGQGAVSGAPLQLRWATVAWFRDGQMTRAAAFARRREALKAVGLEE